MESQRHDSLEARVVKAAEEALAARGHVTALDVLQGIGWLAPSLVGRWKTGEVPILEAVIQVNTDRLSQALRLLAAWAARRSLSPSETAYVARTPSRQPLRFSRSGDPDVERAYRTHWISGELSPTRRERLATKASLPPELVVVSPHARDWKCHRCGGTGDLLVMEPPGPSCLPCAGLGWLVFLPAGDAGLTRRAKAQSATHAVVVRWSRARKRYERQGLLVEPEALRAAERAAR